MKKNKRTGKLCDTFIEKKKQIKNKLQIVMSHIFIKTSSYFVDNCSSIPIHAEIHLVQKQEFDNDFKGASDRNFHKFDWNIALQKQYLFSVKVD